MIPGRIAITVERFPIKPSVKVKLERIALIPICQCNYELAFWRFPRHDALVVARHVFIDSVADRIPRHILQEATDGIPVLPVVVPSAFLETVVFVVVRCCIALFAPETETVAVTLSVADGLKHMQPVPCG